VSRASYIAFLLLFGLLFSLSTWGMVSARLGVDITELTCDAFLARPVEGHVRLRQCLVDVTSSPYANDDFRITTVAALVDSPGDAPRGPARLVLVTDDDALVATVERSALSESEGEAARVVERFPEHFLSVRDLEGEVKRRASTSGEPRQLADLYEDVAAPDAYVLVAGTPRPGAFQVFFLLVQVTCAALALWLFVAQRRWLATADRLRRSVHEPAPVLPADDAFAG